MSKEPIFKQYFQRLAEVAASGDAREESFYSAPESLLEQVAEATGRKQAHVTTLPKKTEAGNPDFRLWNGKERIVGYIEAKKPTEENLNQIEDSAQLRRYRSPKHAKDNEYLFSQALKYSPEWVNKLASEITLEDVVKLAEKWAADARPGEGRLLKWEDVNIDQKPYSVTLYTRKKKDGSRTPRRILIDNRLVSILRKWRELVLETVYLFQQDAQEAPRDKHWATNVQKKACEAAGIPYFNPHCWRHWFTSKLVEDNEDLVKIQKKLGHETIATTAKYTHELVGV